MRTRPWYSPAYISTTPADESLDKNQSRIIFTLHTDPNSQCEQHSRSLSAKASTCLVSRLYSPQKWCTYLSYYDKITANAFRGWKASHLLGVALLSPKQCGRPNSHLPRRAYGISPAEVVRRLLFSLEQSLTTTTEELQKRRP